ncbi:MAG: hypothetical protein D6732_07140 [Methanobacteriota archaeon]|nr:MAG: hypothetical protein D6732_07140 [Euryarchaeota archaeon]
MNTIFTGIILILSQLSPNIYAPSINPLSILINGVNWAFQISVEEIGLRLIFGSFEFFVPNLLSIIFPSETLGLDELLFSANEMLAMTLTLGVHLMNIISSWVVATIYQGVEQNAILVGLQVMFLSGVFVNWEQFVSTNPEKRHFAAVFNMFMGIGILGTMIAASLLEQNLFYELNPCMSLS